MKNKIKNLMRAGLGRRKISKDLSLPESLVRKIMKGLVDAGAAQYPRAGRPPGASLSDPKSRPPLPPLDPPRLNTEAYRQPQSLVVKRKGVEKKVLVISDVHVPYECKDSMALFYAYAKDNVPEEVVLLGDILDFFSVSKYEKCMRNKLDFPEEIQAGKRFIKQIRKAFPTQKITMLAGNHEFRAQAYIIRNAARLSGLPELELDSLLGLRELDIDYYPAGQHIMVGEMVLVHGDIARKGAGSTARGLHGKYLNSVLCGHIHRSSVGAVRTLKGHDLLVENPCMAKLDVDYSVLPDFVNGFTELSVDKDGTVMAHNHIIRQNRLITPSGTIYEIK